MQNLIKQFILESLEEQEEKSSKKNNLLLEPDDSVNDEGCEKNEQSVSGAVSGVTTPLGTNSGYSGKSLAHKKSSNKKQPNTKK